MGNRNGKSSKGGGGDSGTTSALSAVRSLGNAAKGAVKGAVEVGSDVVTSTMCIKQFRGAVSGKLTAASRKVLKETCEKSPDFCLFKLIPLALSMSTGVTVVAIGPALKSACIGYEDVCSEALKKLLEEIGNMGTELQQDPKFATCKATFRKYSAADMGRNQTGQTMYSSNTSPDPGDQSPDPGDQKPQTAGASKTTKKTSPRVDRRRTGVANAVISAMKRKGCVVVCPSDDTTEDMVACPKKAPTKAKQVPTKAKKAPTKAKNKAPTKAKKKAPAKAKKKAPAKAKKAPAKAKKKAPTATKNSSKAKTKVNKTKVKTKAKTKAKKKKTKTTKPRGRHTFVPNIEVVHLHRTEPSTAACVPPAEATRRRVVRRAKTAAVSTAMRAVMMRRRKKRE